jgi:proteasome lid subunit RPN8/RPN11
VVIPQDIRAELRAHAADALPNEACGVVVLDGERAVGYVRGTNAAESPFRYHLEVDPEIWFLEDDGYELAVFHSHPETPPRPSRTDIESIGLWEDRPYLILRADTGELSAWRINGGEVREESLEG